MEHENQLISHLPTTFLEQAGPQQCMLLKMRTVTSHRKNVPPFLAGVKFPVWTISEELYAVVHERVCVHTAGDEDGQQAGRATHSQKSQLGDLAGAVEGEEGDGARGHLYQAKDHLGQIDVHSKVRNVESQTIIHEHVGEPEMDGNKQKTV